MTVEAPVDTIETRIAELGRRLSELRLPRDRALYKKIQAELRILKTQREARVVGRILRPEDTLPETAEQGGDAPVEPKPAEHSRAPEPPPATPPVPPKPRSTPAVSISFLDVATAPAPEPPPAVVSEEKPVSSSEVSGRAVFISHSSRD